MRRSLIGAVTACAIAVLAARHRGRLRSRLATPMAGMPRDESPPVLAGTLAATAVVVVGALALQVRSLDAARAVFAGSVVLALVKPASGVLWWTAAAGAVVPPLLTVRHASVRLSAATIPVLVLARALRARPGRRRPRRVSRIEEPLRWMTAVTVLSAAYGMFRPDPGVIPLHRSALVQTYAATLVVLSAAAAVVVGRTLQSPADFRWVWWVVVALGSVQPVLGRFRVDQAFRPTWGALLESHAAAFVLAAMLFSPPARGWVWWLEAAFLAAAFAEVAGLEIVGRYKRQWVSGWIALGVSLGSILALRSPRAFVLALGMAGVAVGIFRDQLRQRLEDATARGDLERPAMWRDALGLAARRPILGVGPGNYMDYMIRYTRAPFGAGPTSRGVHPGIGSAHGNYPQVAAEIGFAGLGTLGWVIARTITSARDVVGRADDPAAAAMAAGALGAVAGQLAASLLGDYLLPSYHNGGHTTFSTAVYTWILVGTIMALEIRAPEASSPHGLLTTPHRR